MTAVIPAKMQSPQDAASATIEGHAYTVDSKGQVKPAVQSHVETLRRHGFTDVIESDETAQDVALMDRDEQIEYIEERGGTVDDPKGIKPKALRIQALRAGGFNKEAESLVTKEKDDGKKKKKG